MLIFMTSSFSLLLLIFCLPLFSEFDCINGFFVHFVHAGAHQSLPRYSVCVCHADHVKFWTESRQRPLGAFGHPSPRRMPQSNHDLGLNQTDVNKNIRRIFLAKHAAAAQVSKTVIIVGPHFHLILRNVSIMYY